MIEEILPLIIKKNRCKKLVPTLNVSWSVIHMELKTRSVDDIRNYWQLKLLPILVPEMRKSFLSSQEWKEEDDIELLTAIYEQDVSKPIDIDFTDIQNGRTPSEN